MEIIGGIGVTAELDYSSLQTDFQAAIQAAQDAADKIAQSLSIELPAIDAGSFTASLSALVDQATEAAQEILRGLTIQMPDLDTSAVVESLTTLSSTVETTVGNITAELSDVKVPELDTSAAETSLISLSSTVETTVETIVSDFAGVAIPDLDTSPAQESLTALSSVAETTAEAIVTDFASVPIPELDTTAAQDSLTTLTSTAETTVETIAADFASVPVPELDTSPAQQSLTTLATTAETTVQEVTADFQGLEIPAPDISPVTTALDTLANEAKDTSETLKESSTGADAFFAALDRLVGEGASVNEAFQQLTGSAGSFNDAIANGSLATFADDFGKLDEQASKLAPDMQGAADAIEGVGGAAATASGQLSLFDDAMVIPVADETGQLNLFANELEIVTQDSTAAGGALDTLGSAASDLDPKFTAATEAVEKAQGAMQQFSDGAQKVITAQEQADSTLRDAQSVMAELQKAYNDGTISEEALARAAQQLQAAFNAANPGKAAADIHDLGSAAEYASTAFGTLQGILGALGISLTVQGFINLAESVGEAADSLTRADASLTALTGDATTAEGIIGQLEQLGVQDGLSMPGLLQAAQNMAAMLPAGTNIVGILNQLADASASTGKSVESLTSSFDRIINSTSVNVRAFQQMGLTMDDLKGAMEDAGATAGEMAGKVKDAFNNLDQHDKIVVMQEALEKFKGVAEEVANTTFGGIWKQAIAEWDKDIGIVLKDLGQITVGKIAQNVKDAMDFIASAFVVAGTLIVAAIDEIKGKINEAGIAITGFAQAGKQALMGDFGAATETISKTFAQVQAAAQKTADAVSKDWAGGVKIVGDIMNQTATKADAAAGSMDHLGGSTKSAALNFAAAESAVRSFDDVALSGAGSVGSLQAAFENTGKAINLVAKADLPLAIQAVTDYNNAMVTAGAKASILDAGFQEQSRLVGQLAKVDLPGAIASMAGLTKTYLDGNAPIALVNAAFADTEKQINALAKTDIPQAIEQQKNYIAVLEDSQAPLTLLTDAFTNEQKLIQSLANTDLPGAIKATADLAQAEIDAGEPVQVVTKTFEAQQKLIQTLAQTDLPGAITAMGNLATAEQAANEPAQVITETFGAEQKLIQQLAHTDLPDAITAMGNLAQAEIAAKEPAQTVTDTFLAQQKLLQQLATTDLKAAADGLDNLIQAEIRAKEPLDVVDQAFRDQQAIFDKMATGGNFAAAISGLEHLAQVEHDFAPTGTEFVRTLQDEQAVFDKMAGTNLQGAIDGLRGLVDQEVALNAPTATVTATLDDERNKIVALGGRDVPAAISALQGLIDKQIALKQPVADVLTSLKDELDLLGKLANTDLPAAIEGYKNYLDELGRVNELYKAINDAGARTVQQQEFQISSQKQLLDSVNALNLAYGDRLKIEGQIAQEEINLGQAQGQNVSDQILGLEKIKLKEEELASATHGMADAEVAAIKDVNKGFDQLGQSIADAIVNGKNLGDALIAQFKKIAASILGDLIQGALQPLKQNLLDLEQSILPTLSQSFKVAGESASQAAEGFKNETDAINATIGAQKDVTKSTEDMAGSTEQASAQMGNFASSLTSWMSAIGAVVGAIAGIVGDVYLAAIDTKLFHVETSLVEIRNETQNARKDAWDQFNQMYGRVGEIKNDADSMKDSLIQMATNGTGQTGGTTATQDLDIVATSIQHVEANTGYINQSIQALNTTTVQWLQEIVSRLIDINSTLFKINTSISAGGQALSQSLSDMAANSETMSARAEQGTEQLARAITESGQDVSSGVADGAHAVTKGINDLKNSAIDLDNSLISIAQSQYNAAMSADEQLTALGNEYNLDMQAVQDALAEGDLMLADHYQQAAQAVMRQIDSVREGQNVQTGVLGNIYTGVVNGAQQASFAATSGSHLVAANVTGAGNAVVQAVNNSASTIASAVSAALGSFNPSGGGGSYSSAAHPTSGAGTGGSTAPYAGQTATAPVNSPGTGAYNPTTKSSPTYPSGPAQKPVVVPGYQGDTTQVVPDTDATPAGTLPVFATGGYMQQSGLAILEAGEYVLTQPQVDATISAMGNEPAAKANKPGTRVLPGPNDYNPAWVNPPHDQTPPTDAQQAQKQADALQALKDQLALLQGYLQSAIAQGSAVQVEEFKLQIAALQQKIAAMGGGSGPAARGAPVQDGSTPSQAPDETAALQAKIDHDIQALNAATAAGNAQQIADAQKALDIDKQHLAALQSQTQATDQSAVLQAKIDHDIQELNKAIQGGDPQQIAQAQQALAVDKEHLTAAQQQKQNIEQIAAMLAKIDKDTQDLNAAKASGEDPALTATIQAILTRDKEALAALQSQTQATDQSAVLQAKIDHDIQELNKAIQGGDPQQIAQAQQALAVDKEHLTAAQQQKQNIEQIAAMLAKIDKDTQDLNAAKASGEDPALTATIQAILTRDKEALAALQSQTQATDQIAILQAKIDHDIQDLNAATAGGNADQISQAQQVLALDKQHLTALQQQQQTADQTAILQNKIDHDIQELNNAIQGGDSQLIALAQRQLELDKQSLTALQQQTQQAAQQAQQQTALEGAMQWLGTQTNLSASDKAIATATYKSDAAGGSLPVAGVQKQSSFSGYNPYTTPSFDLGGMVLTDQIAKVHAGEWVIPPAPSTIALPADVAGRISVPNLPAAPTSPNVPSVSPGGQGSSGNMSITIQNLNLTGVQNPRELWRQLMEEAKKLSPRFGAFSQ